MRVHLKGIHSVRSKGCVYHYAWRGGPRIKAEPGSPAFMREYQEAHAARQRPPENCLFTLIVEFKQSAEFGGLSARTKSDYLTFLREIETHFGTMPLRAAEDPRARGVFKSWRDGFSDRPRKADHLWTVLCRVLSFGKDRGRLTTNVCERGGRLYKVNRREKVWSEDQIGAFLAVASPELRLAMLMALWTGQRQGDLLKARWGSIEKGRLEIQQSKRGARVLVPLSGPLLAALADAPRQGLTILTNSAGKTWTEHGFRSSWRKACARAGITGVTFHDLRGTAVTRLALAECTVPQIAAITGHSLSQAQTILHTHYLGGGAELAEEAMRKLETRTQTVKLPVKP